MFTKGVTTLKLIDILPAAISSRDVVKELLERKLNETEWEQIHLDFERIEFISRSAAHELLKMKERLENQADRPRQIIFTNPDENVAVILRLVAANKAYNPEDRPALNARNVDIRELV